MLREARLMLRERPLHLIRSARSSACLPRSLSDIRRLLLSLNLEQRRLTLSDSSSPNPTLLIQSALCDEVVLVPPGVSRTLVPLDGALVLQIL